MSKNKFHIHVIDDNEVSLSYIKLIIECLRDDITLNVYYSALDSLNKIEQGEIPDLIFCDINMPKINGFDYLKKIDEFSSQNFFDSVPLIMMTSAFNEDLTLKCKAVYTKCEVHNKPVKIPVMQTILDKFLKEN